jgi:drug/metabolite transporter (DMT)-like permease
MLGMMVTTIGVGVVLIKANLVNLLHLSFNFGDLIMVGAIFVYGIFSLLIRYSPKQVNQWSFLWVLFVIGALELLPLQLLEYQAGYRMNLTIGPILGLSYIIIGPALLAYKFYTSAVLTLGATRTGLFFYWLPIASVILAILILGEPLQIYHLSGFVLVVFGLRLGLAKKEG